MSKVWEKFGSGMRSHIFGLGLIFVVRGEFRDDDDKYACLLAPLIIMRISYRTQVAPAAAPYIF